MSESNIPEFASRVAAETPGGGRIRSGDLMEHNLSPGRVYEPSQAVPTEKLAGAFLFDGQYQPLRL